MDGSQQTESAASGTSDAGGLLQGTAAVAGNCESGSSLQAYAAAGGSEISSGDSVQTEQVTTFSIIRYNPGYDNRPC